MIVLTNHLLRSYLERLGHSPEPGRLHICGLRGADRVGTRSIERNTNQPNRSQEAPAGV